MSRHIVMTSSAKMPSRCKGHYRNVAVVEIDDEVTPTMISERARGVRRIVCHYGPQNVGKTDRCAYRRALAEANALADQLNAAA